jgi:hypothetical protein
MKAAIGDHGSVAFPGDGASHKEFFIFAFESRRS